MFGAVATENIFFLLRSPMLLYQAAACRVGFASPIVYTRTPRKIPGLFQPLPCETASSAPHRQHLVHHNRHTWYLAPHSRQARLALTLTRRHTTTDHRREHGGSKRELEHGADARRWAVSTSCQHCDLLSPPACMSQKKKIFLVRVCP